MNPYQITYPTTVHPAVLHEFNRGVERAREAYYESPHSSGRQCGKTCKTCGGEFGNQSYATCSPCRKKAKETPK